MTSGRIISQFTFSLFSFNRVLRIAFKECRWRVGTGVCLEVIHVCIHVKSQSLEVRNMSTTHPASKSGHKGLSLIYNGFRISQMYPHLFVLKMAVCQSAINIIAKFQSQSRIHLVLSCANIKSLEQVLVTPIFLVFTSFFQVIL